MRPLKFRFRDKETGKIIREIIFLDNEGIPFKYVPGTNEIEVIDIGVIIREQYIGFKDKNNKEIYEGDIVKSSANNCTYLISHGDYQCEYSEHMDLHFGFYYHCIQDYGTEGLCSDDYKFIEVIGNINKNPELLDAKTNKKERK